LEVYPEKAGHLEGLSRFWYLLVPVPHLKEINVMSTVLHDDVSGGVLRRMKEGGFDFASVHPIEFYAIFPDEERALRATRNFRGESLHALVTERDDGDWYLQVSKVMHVTSAGIDDFEQGMHAVVAPLGGKLDGWGVTQEVHVA
jgi:hypothetical protein